MRRVNTLQMMRVVSALLALVAISGCHAHTTNAKVIQAAFIPEQEDSADFLDRASEMDLMDMDNALHGVCLLTEGEDTHADFQTRVSTLQKMGIVPSDWTLTPGQSLTKGKLAYMVYRACDVKEKGAMLKLLGPNRRYCLRELQYHGMMAEGNESMQVTGMEFAAVLTRADAYKRNGRFPNEVGQPE